MEQSWHPVLIRAINESLQSIFADGYYADKVLERTFKQNKKWGSRDRRFIAETVYTITRFFSLLTFYAEAEKDFLKIWAVYEMWKNKKDATPFLEKNFNLKISVHWIQKRINILPDDPWTKHATPQWLYKKFEKQFPKDIDKILKALNEVAPVCLRTNTLKTTREELKSFLENEGVTTTIPKNSKDGLILRERKNVFITDSFKKGFFEVQDIASQKVSELLSPKPKERIADMCAGAGGKTLHLAALMQNKGTLLACDIFPRKIEELKTRAKRAGVSNLRTELIEGTKSIKRLFDSFDGVLIDAPCSGSGVLRRNPDSKWKLNEDEIERLKKLQEEILITYSKLVKRGGRLVYATCSLLDEENSEQIDKFLRGNTDFEKVGTPFKSRPDLGEGDGFFAQELKRK